MTTPAPTEPNSGPNETAERLLDSAERLFADTGVSATSLRQITTAAKANLASVSYHFGSKEGLLREVIGRRINPINEARLKLLDELDAADTPATVEQILDAFLRPIFDQPQAARQTFTRLMSRLHHSPDPMAMEYLQEVLGPIAMRTLGALTRALPGVDANRIFLRAHFMIGSMLHCLSEWDPRNCVPDLPECNLKEDQLLSELVQFSTAGFLQLNSQR